MVIRTISSYFNVLFIHRFKSRVGASSLRNLAITKYCVLPDMCFIVVALDDAFGYQCPNTRLLYSSRVLLVSLPAVLRTPVHDYGFRHLIDESPFGY